MLNNNSHNLIGAIEAVLFTHGEPLEIKKISKIMKTEENEIIKAAEGLKEKYKLENNGLIIISSGDKIQLATKPEFSELVENFIKDEFKEQLTPTSLETLSLISYLGPISKPQIDYYRGVNSVFTIRGLMIRGLIERIDDPGKKQGYLYRQTFDLLKHLGISDIKELPDYEKYKSFIK